MSLFHALIPLQDLLIIFISLFDDKGNCYARTLNHGKEAFVAKQQVEYPCEAKAVGRLNRWMTSLPLSKRAFQRSERNSEADPRRERLVNSTKEFALLGYRPSLEIAAPVMQLLAVKVGNAEVGFDGRRLGLKSPPRIDGANVPGHRHQRILRVGTAIVEIANETHL